MDCVSNGVTPAVGTTAIVSGTPSQLRRKYIFNFFQKVLDTRQESWFYTFALSGGPSFIQLLMI